MGERRISFWRRLLDSVRSMLQDEEANDTERRFWVRYPSAVETWCRRRGAPEDQRVPARVVNVSMGGLNLLVGREFHTGDTLRVEVPSAAPRLVDVLVCVLHVTMLDNGEYSIGCVIIGELSDAEMEAVGAEWRRPMAHDHRHWIRYRTEATAIYEIVGESGTARSTAAVGDVSATGVALLVDEEVPVSTVLLVDLKPPDRQGPATKPACVVRVAPKEDGGWLLGCIFIRTLNKAEFKAFR
jgi:hypothetical protein